jgi:uncharacterized protein (DUF362 family)
MMLHDIMAATPPDAPLVRIKPLRANQYLSKGKSVVAVIRSNSRLTAFREVLRLLGGIDPILQGVTGTILLKPNCNTDDPFPASSHPDMIRLVAEHLINSGFPSKKIVIGDMGGKGRGLPTKWTMENIGLRQIAQDLGVRLSFFEEDDWVTITHPKMTHWPDGGRIPRLLYDAERVISLPAMKTHEIATFTLSLKSIVGLTDALGRDRLHNGERALTINEKIAELNLAYTADLIILDGMKCFVTKGPSEGKLACPGVVIAAGDRVAVDAVGVAILKQFNAENIANRRISDHKQLQWGDHIGLGTLDPNRTRARVALTAEINTIAEAMNVFHPSTIWRL